MNKENIAIELVLNKIRELKNELLYEGHISTSFCNCSRENQCELYKIPCRVADKLCMHYDIGELLGEIDNLKPNIYKKECAIEKIDKATHMYIDEMANIMCDNMKAIGHESTEYLKDDNAIKPSHYKSGEFDVIAFCQKHNLSFDVGNVIKYVTRAGKKKDNSELQDLNKAMEYLKRRIEFVKGE